MTIAGLLRHILEEVRTIDIYDLIDHLSGDYGINLEKSKIIGGVGRAEMYYDQIMGKVYLNKDLYYEELEEELL